MDMLMFQLNKSSSKPLYDQLYEAIKNSIIQQKIPATTKLPSKRKLADFLAISQTTVELAYGQLLAEGYICSKSRVGYFVEDLEGLTYVKQKTPTSLKVDEKQHIEIDFTPSQIDTYNFPFTTWRKYTKEAIGEQMHHLLLVGNAKGEFSLRKQIADYLFQSRGVLCTPEQIVIGSGTEQLLPMIIRLLGENNNYAIENPGYKMTSYILKQNYQQITPIPVDKDGLKVKSLTQTDANIAYVTPSHQFPTGAILSASRRSQLLTWANQQSNRYIIEDDYDSEFRYVGKPISSLQGMDQNEKVIYLSTFSKSLMPSLRLAYFVLPNHLLQRYEKVFSYYTCTVPRIDQYVLAKFMEDGHFSKHLNRMRKVYRKKLEILSDALTEYSPTVSISGEQAGMHIMLNIHDNRNAKQLSTIAKEHHIRLTAISDYELVPATENEQKLLLGFGGLAEEEIESSIEKLMTIYAIKKAGRK